MEKSIHWRFATCCVADFDVKEIYDLISKELSGLNCSYSYGIFSIEWIINTGISDEKYYKQRLISMLTLLLKSKISSKSLNSLIQNVVISNIIDIEDYPTLYEKINGWKWRSKGFGVCYLYYNGIYTPYPSSNITTVIKPKKEKEMKLPVSKERASFIKQVLSSEDQRTANEDIQKILEFYIKNSEIDKSGVISFELPDIHVAPISIGFSKDSLRANIDSLRANIRSLKALFENPNNSQCARNLLKWKNWILAMCDWIIEHSEAHNTNEIQSLKNQITVKDDRIKYLEALNLNQVSSIKDLSAQLAVAKNNLAKCEELKKEAELSCKDWVSAWERTFKELVALKDRIKILANQ